jgi:hypothetical protein
VDFGYTCSFFAKRADFSVVVFAFAAAINTGDGSIHSITTNTSDMPAVLDAIANMYDMCTTADAAGTQGQDSPSGLARITKAMVPFKQQGAIRATRQSSALAKRIPVHGTAGGAEASRERAISEIRAAQVRTVRETRALNMKPLGVVGDPLALLRDLRGADPSSPMDQTPSIDKATFDAIHDRSFSPASVVTLELQLPPQHLSCHLL